MRVAVSPDAPVSRREFTRTKIATRYTDQHGSMPCPIESPGRGARRFGGYLSGSFKIAGGWGRLTTSTGDGPAAAADGEAEHGGAGEGGVGGGFGDGAHREVVDGRRLKVRLESASDSTAAIDSDIDRTGPEQGAARVIARADRDRCAGQHRAGRTVFWSESVV